MSEPDVVLSVRDLRKRFGASEALCGVSFDVRRGEIVSIIGPSGSGKSTLLRCINRLEQPDSGSIVVNGRLLCGTDAAGQRQYADPVNQKKIQLDLGLVFQDFNLFPHWSIMRNITEAQTAVLRRTPAQARAKAERLLNRLGLTEKADAYPCELSGGQQQRVAIARALALEPAILCFDEPTSALDPALTFEVIRVIRSLADVGIAMLIVTHEMQVARSVSERVLFLYQGELIADGRPADILAPENPVTGRFLHDFSEEMGTMPDNC